MAVLTLQVESTVANEREWQAALAAWKDALAQAERLTKELDAVCLAFEALEPKEEEIERIARRRFPFNHVRQVACTLDLETEWARFLAGEGKIWWGGNPDKVKAEMRADLDAIADWRARRNRAMEVTGYETANDLYDAAWERETETRSLLFKQPAPDAEGALLKLDLLFGPDAMDRSGDGESYCDSWTAEWVGPTMDDVHRLLKAAA